MRGKEIRARATKLIEIVLLAQILRAAQAPKVTFDISSVKRARDRTAQASIRRLDPGIVSVSSMTLLDMIELFYHVKPYQVLGGPTWVHQERFDVTGKDSSYSTSALRPEGAAWSSALDAADEQMRELLKKRFGLQLHHELRTLPSMVLLLAPNAKLMEVPCSTGYTLQHGAVTGEIRLASLAALLKTEYGMPVTDGTGLKGCYHLEARWGTDPDDESSPPLPTALHDLGLRLKKSRGEVDVLVIERAELPEPD